MKTKNSLPYRKIRAINDPDVIKFLGSRFKDYKNVLKSLDDENIHLRFLKHYQKWIKSSKLNNLKIKSPMSFGPSANAI